MASNDNGADIYLILLRPTRVPVAGEAVSHLFQGQILVESLSWRLHNDEEKLQGAGDGSGGKASLIQGDNPAALMKDLNQKVARAQDSLKRDLGRAKNDGERSSLQEKHDKWLSQSMDDAQRKIEQAAGIGGGKSGAKDKPAGKSHHDAGDRNPNFEFTIKKRVDIASTQMLNSMKAGDIFPSGTLTIHKRSATVMDGTSLVFTIQKIRLVDYRLQVEVTDTMTEMMEEWTCEFGSLAYVYKNPPSHYSHGNAGQAAAKTLSQGTMRAFTMKNIGSPI
jgi:type VI protein secretion system component Hcp